MADSLVFCPSCVDVLNDPVILDCSHNICFHCAEELVGLAMRLKKGEKGDTIGVPCPACAVVTTVSKNEGASGLKKNVTLKNVLGKIKATAETTNRDMKCGLCEASKPTMECEQCQVPLCENCTTYLHRKGMFKTHTVLPLGKAGSKPRAHICPEHGKEYDLYCSSDKEIVCSHCLLLGAHKHHPCVSLKEAAVQVRSALNDGVGSLGVTRDRIALTKDSIVASIPHLHSEYEKSVEEVKVVFATLRHALDAREKMIKKQLYEVREVKFHLLAQQIDLLEASLAQVDGGLSAAEKLMGREDYETVKMKPQISARLDNLSSAPYALIPATDPSLTFTCDHRMAQLLGDYGKVDNSILQESNVDVTVLRRIEADLQHQDAEAERAAEAAQAAQRAQIAAAQAIQAQRTASVPVPVQAQPQAMPQSFRPGQPPMSQGRFPGHFY